MKFSRNGKGEDNGQRKSLHEAFPVKLEQTRSLSKFQRSNPGGDNKTRAEETNREGREKKII